MTNQINPFMAPWIIAQGRRLTADEIIEAQRLLIERKRRALREAELRREEFERAAARRKEKARAYHAGQMAKAVNKVTIRIAPAAPQLVRLFGMNQLCKDAHELEVTMDVDPTYHALYLLLARLFADFDPAPVAIFGENGDMVFTHWHPTILAFNTDADAVAFKLRWWDEIGFIEGE